MKSDLVNKVLNKIKYREELTNILQSAEKACSNTAQIKITISSEWRSSHVTSES